MSPKLLSHEKLVSMDDHDRLKYELKNYYLFNEDDDKNFDKIEIIGRGHLEYGDKLQILWKEDFKYITEELGLEDLAKGQTFEDYAFLNCSDDGLLIRLPDSDIEPLLGGMVYSEVRAPKEAPEPTWVSLCRLLSFEECYKIRVIK